MRQHSKRWQVNVISSNALFLFLFNFLCLTNNRTVTVKVCAMFLATSSCTIRCILSRKPQITSAPLCSCAVKYRPRACAACYSRSSSARRTRSRARTVTADVSPRGVSRERVVCGRVDGHGKLNDKTVTERQVSEDSAFIC